MTSHKEVMIEAAKAAATVIKKYYKTDLQVEFKNAKEVFSKADVEAEHAILNVLQEFPYKVIGEETGTKDADSEYSWVIDPIDGTNNFLRRVPCFVTSIALMKGDHAEAGVILNPILDELYVAERGQGASLNGKPLSLQPPLDKKIHVLHDAHPRHVDLADFHAILAVAYKGMKIQERQFGASAFCIPRLAAGLADVFIGHGQELYDVAAALLIAREAGLKTTDWNGNPWQPLGTCLVASPELHAQFLQRLRQ